MEALKKRVLAIEKQPTVTEDAVNTKVNAVQASIKLDMDNLKERVEKAEQKPTYKEAAEKSKMMCNIVLRKVKESAGENLVNKVSAIIKEGCKLKDIQVTAADRKGKGYNGNPPIIIATLANQEQVQEVLKSKKALKDSRNHKNIIIHEDQDLESRITRSNTITLLKAMGKDKQYFFKGRSLVEKKGNV